MFKVDGAPDLPTPDVLQRQLQMIQLQAMLLQLAKAYCQALQEVAITQPDLAALATALMACPDSWRAIEQGGGLAALQFQPRLLAASA